MKLRTAKQDRFTAGFFQGFICKAEQLHTQRIFADAQAFLHAFYTVCHNDNPPQFSDVVHHIL